MDSSGTQRNMTTNATSGIGFTRLIELDRTDSIKLRQDGCLARINKGLAKITEGCKKNGCQSK
jgi:hypothetical protein